MTVCATLKLGFHVVVKVPDQDLSHGDRIARFRENAGVYPSWGRRPIRPHRLGSKNQAATASTGGPQPSKESTVGSSKQLGHTTTSCTISKPTPPGSSDFFGRPRILCVDADTEER